MKKLFILFLLLATAFEAWLLLTPVPINALAWSPPSAPGLVRAFEPNQALRAAHKLGVGEVAGGEDVAVDSAGRAYAGTADGEVLRIDADGRVEPFARTGGRPLGLHFDVTGRLWVADAWKGLLSISPDGQVQTHLTEVEGVPLRFTNDLDIAADGRIYFTDSSRFSQPDYMLDAFEARPHGRLMRYDPVSGEVELLLDGLYFANGVALSRDEGFVLVNETWRYRVTRYWLKGDKAGTSDTFIDNLPGFPDGIAADRQGNFWLALPTLRNRVLDTVHPHPWVKGVIARLPPWLQPVPERYGLIARLDEQGRVLETLHDPGGEVVWEITSVQPAADGLYLGTLHNDWVARLPR